MNELKLVNPEEIDLILKLRKIESKKHAICVMYDINKILDILDFIYDKDYEKYGYRTRINLDFIETKNAINLAKGRIVSKKHNKMGGRTSRITKIQREIRSWGYKIFIVADYVQQQLEKDFAKSTIYEALRKL